MTPRNDLPRGPMLLSQRLLRRCAPALAALVVFVVVASPALAQGMPGQGLGSQSMMPYRFVFIAYAIAWILVFGWIVSVARRLARLSRRLGD